MIPKGEMNMSGVSSEIDKIISLLEKFSREPTAKVFDDANYELVKVQVQSHELSAYLKEAMAALTWCKLEIRKLAYQKIGVDH